MTAAWAKKTPADFEFAVKAWQKFTHSKRLGEEMRENETAWPPPSQADVDLFTQGIGPLADSGKLGVLLFQFPPSFHYTEENVARLGWILRVFDDYPKAIELRHRSWSDRHKETRSLLEPVGAAWAVIDEPRFASSVREPVETASGLFYLRLHGRNREKWWNHREVWERYDYLYSPEEIRSFAQKIQEKASQSPRTKIYVFFNNHARGQAVASGLMLKSEIGEVVEAKVPRAFVEAYPQLVPIVRTEGPDTLF